jgi:diaminohydroxyphosphoribosylaminopyrimidine deaminase/5-amino-6-(5-phosphoribosylamino)uracil reductase
MEVKFLERCLELAQYGETLAHPNPIVGCVIVNKGKIIAEGFHRIYGDAHAELSAIHHCEQSETTHLLKDSTIFVSLEPCAHHGKTPPCADLIIKHKFKELIFSSYDPNPEVSGKGIARIKSAGIKVIEPNQLEASIKARSDYLNRKFFKWIETKEPWLSLKLALDIEASMIAKDERWITNTESRKDVHRLRSTHDLIISGAETIRTDDSKLNIRHTAEELNLADIKNPDIAILYQNNQLDDNHPIFNQVPERKVFQENNLSNILKNGYKRILIESGPRLSKYFLELGLLDEIIIYQKFNSKRKLEWQDRISKLGFKLYKSETIKAISPDATDDIKEIWIAAPSAKARNDRFCP